jgi:hypothetical protein
MFQGFHASLTFLLVLGSFIATAQDTIVTLRNETLDVKVLEIDYTNEIVKFKKAALPNGPTFSERLSDLFLISIANTSPIYNDPYENPYPGYQTVVPISMKRLERYSSTEIEQSQNISLAGFEAYKGKYENSVAVTVSEKRFKDVFNTVVQATKQYCKSRKFTIQDELEWKYVYADCIDHAEAECKAHSSSEHSFLQNAYSLGNGLFLFSDWFLGGLTDEEVAGIISHEIGHALAQHSLERLRKTDNLEDASSWIALGITLRHGGRYDANKTGVEQIGTSFFLNPYIRTHEEEADKIGVVLMELAGYNPQSIIRFWRREGGGVKTMYWDTHPAGQDRATNLDAFIRSNEFKILTKKR